MNKVHYGHCIIGVALAATLLVAFGVSTSTLGYLAVAALCPLMMFVMMRTMMRDQAKSVPKDVQDQQPARHQS